MSFIDADSKNFVTDFGGDATVGGVACRGIFDENYGEALGFIAGASPSFLVPANVLAAQDMVVSIGARNFLVTSIEPDGTGFQRLKLEAA